MLSITIVELSYLALKTHECGTQWDVVMIKWEKAIKLNVATREPKIAKIGKESPYIKWVNFTTQWVLRMNKRQCMLSS